MKTCREIFTAVLLPIIKTQTLKCATREWIALEHPITQNEKKQTWYIQHLGWISSAPHSENTLKNHILYDLIYIFWKKQTTRSESISEVMGWVVTDEEKAWKQRGSKGNIRGNDKIVLYFGCGDNCVNLRLLKFMEL